MSLNQFLVILRARWRIAFYTLFGVIITVLAVSLIWPKQYKGIASIVVDMTDPQATVANADMAGQMVASYVTTQADIIESHRVAERVVKMLKLDQQPEARRRWAKSTDDDITVPIADYLLDKKLLVAPVHESPTHSSNVIDISVKWSDPTIAAALANAFAQVAIETNIELKVESAKQYARWFDEHSRALRANLEAKQKQLSDFQKANGIIETDEKLDVENARLAELSTELVTIQTLRQESESHQRQVGGAAIESLPEVLQSPTIQNLKAALAVAEAKQKDVAERLGKNYPDYRQVESEITNLRDRIARESANIAASLGSTNQINIRRENDVRTALEAQKKRVLELKHQHDEAAVLDSDVTAAQKELDDVTQRLAQSSLESVTQKTNVVQLTTATAPKNPSSPNLAINMILAVFLGGLFGIGAALAAEMRDPRIREDEDMLELGVPLLGKVNSVVVRAKDVRLPPAQLEPSVI